MKIVFSPVGSSYEKQITLRIDMKMTGAGGLHFKTGDVSLYISPAEAKFLAQAFDEILDLATPDGENA